MPQQPKVEFYMARPEELIKQPDALPMFTRIARLAPDPHQNDVLAALWLLWNFEHALDDLLDESDLPDATKENVARGLFELVETILTSDEPTDNGFVMSLKQLIRQSGWDDERAALADRAARDFIGDLMVNSFIRRHAQQFLAMYQMMIARMLDGDEMAASDNAFRRQCAPAVRCADVDFIVHVAKLAGGWEAMREVGRLRDYDPEEIT